MFGYATHEVLNQAPPLENFNGWLTDEALRSAITTCGCGWTEARLERRSGHALSALANEVDFTPIIQHATAGLPR